MSFDIIRSSQFFPSRLRSNGAPTLSIQLSTHTINVKKVFPSVPSEFSFGLFGFLATFTILLALVA